MAAKKTDRMWKKSQNDGNVPIIIKIRGNPQTFDVSPFNEKKMTLEGQHNVHTIMEILSEE